MTSAWRPSSGTEGEVFAANRCERCVNDRWDHVTASGQSCPIWMNALAGVDDFHLYWDADAEHGECDMFYAKDEAQAAGVQAAREAVEALRGGWVDLPILAEALAAIDALRGDAPHLDPCDCADCVAAAREAQAELDFASLHEEGLA